MCQQHAITRALAEQNNKSSSNEWNSETRQMHVEWEFQDRCCDIFQQKNNVIDGNLQIQCGNSKQYEPQRIIMIFLYRLGEARYYCN